MSDTTAGPERLVVDHREPTSKESMAMASDLKPSGPRSGIRRRALWARSAVVMAVLIAILYVIEAVDAATHYDLNHDGIRSRDADGLWGVLFSPVLHANFEHLTSNALVGAVLGFLLLLVRRFMVTTAIVWVVSGFGVWLFGPTDAVTIGASGVIFGWLAFLLVRGVVNRSVGQLGLGVLLFLVYGSLLWGVLPGRVDISWQAHAFGAVGGVLAALVLAGRDRRRRASAAPTSPPGSPAPGSTTFDVGRR